MNVIVANKYQSMLQGLSVDVIKTMYGEYTADEIISSFQNFYFQRMILDITAIKNYQDITNLQKLSISLDMDKVILLLDDSPESTSPAYLSQLISMGIYNFTKNNEGIMYLYNNPNSYRDVAHIHQLNTVQQAEIQQPSIGVPIVQESYSDEQRIIGIKNITKQSGATTLTYMLKQQLRKNYNVAAIEMNKRDFMYFNDKELVNATNNDIGGVVSKNNGKDVILIDVNDSSQAEALCTEMIYLIQPSMIKLNKLLLTDRHILEKLQKKRIVLNQSMLNTKDVLDFEYESRLKVFYNVPPLNERDKDIYAIDAFLSKLGFIKQNSGEEQTKKNKKWGLF